MPFAIIKCWHFIVFNIFIRNTYDSVYSIYVNNSCIVSMMQLGFWAQFLINKFLNNFTNYSVLTISPNCSNGVTVAQF